MRQYIVRRLLLAAIVLFGISIVVYFIFRMAPGDYITRATAGNPNVTLEMIERLQKLYGLDKGIVAGYLSWASEAIRGNLGDSFLFQKPVTEIIGSKLWISLSLSIPTLILQYLIAVPLGIISATKKYSKTDYLLTGFALFCISLPSFFFASMLQWILAIKFNILPLQGMVTARMDYEGFDLAVDIFMHFVIPVIVLTTISIGGLMRYTRTNMLEVLNSDYIRTARAKGLDERTVVYKHAFRNTLVLLVTLMATILPGLFSGSMIAEQVFAIDGLGYTNFKAIGAGDIPFLMGNTMFFSVLTLFGILIADLTYAIVDPRVRLN